MANALKTNYVQSDIDVLSNYSFESLKHNREQPALLGVLTDRTGSRLVLVDRNDVNLFWNTDGNFTLHGLKERFISLFGFGKLANIDFKLKHLHRHLYAAAKVKVEDKKTESDKEKIVLENRKDQLKLDGKLIKEKKEIEKDIWSTLITDSKSEDEQTKLKAEKSFKTAFAIAERAAINKNCICLLEKLGKLVGKYWDIPSGESFAVPNGPFTAKLIRKQYVYQTPFAAYFGEKFFSWGNGEMRKLHQRDITIWPRKEDGSLDEIYCKKGEKKIYRGLMNDAVLTVPPGKTLSDCYYISHVEAFSQKEKFRNPL